MSIPGETFFEEQITLLDVSFLLLLYTSNDMIPRSPCLFSLEILDGPSRFSPKSVIQDTLDWELSAEFKMGPHLKWVPHPSSSLTGGFSLYTRLLKPSTQTT